MIDTVRLILDEGTFYIGESERFQPNAKYLIGVDGIKIGRGSFKAVLNPSKQETKDHGYAPRLTLRRRPPGVTELVIEFSIPKLLYGNNFDEVCESDFPAVIEALRVKLTAWNICIFGELLRQAPVSGIHYGKNIILPPHTHCQSVIRLLSKAPTNQWFDTNRVEFRNSGHLYKIHSDSFELAFYDKVKDLQLAKRGAKRAYEADSKVQMDLFEQGEYPLSLQVLRMEARLNTRGQIQRLLRAIDVPDDDLRFDALFSQAIAQKALLHYWRHYQETLPLVVMAQRDAPHELLAMLKYHDPDATMGTLQQRLGALTLIGDIGWDGLRTYWQGSPKAFSRLKTDLSNLPNAHEVSLSDLNTIETTLCSFNPVKMEAHRSSNIPLMVN